MIRATIIAGALAAAGAPAFAQVAQLEHEVLAGDPVSPDDLAKAADAAAEVANLPATPEDLAKAADAAADAAAVPAPAATAPATKPSSDDIDLSALGLDPSAAAFDDKLNLYGFADFKFVKDHWNKDVPTIQRDTKTFMLGNLNLYLARHLTPQARAFAEVRFTFLPNGGTDASGKVVDTTATDLTNFTRPAQWGGIVIERAYVEYDITEYATIRAGHWLTPYGIWNIDHGSPAIIAVNRPYIIGEQFFPEHQTGLDLFGSHTESGYKLDYHLTASNGRGGAEAQTDQDSKLAFGGRLELATPWGLRVGGSYYRGRYTGLATTAGQPALTYLEASYGGDAQFDRGPLHLQGEVIARERHYEAGARAPAAAGFVADGRDLGFYVLAGYRFDQLWNVMPFAIYENYQPTGQTFFDQIDGYTVGLNFRPSPSLVLKAEVVVAGFKGGFLADAVIWEYTAQASWMF